MSAIQLVKNENTEVTFLASSKTLILKLKGFVSKKHLEALRQNVFGMFGTLGINQMVLNTTESEYQEFDFTDEERKSFYKEAERKGIQKLTIVYPNKYFIRQIRNQWKEFFKKNNIRIRVSARVL